MEQQLEIDEAYILQYWNNFIIDVDDISIMNAEEVYLDNFHSLIVSENKELTTLYFKPKAWKLTLSKNLINNALNTAFLGAIIYKTEYSQFTSVVIKSLLTSLFQIERIEITKREEKIYMNLPIKKVYKTSEEWFESLPEKTKKDIRKIDFQDFMEKFVLAGLAKRDKNDEEKYLILKKGKHLFKIHLL